MRSCIKLQISWDGGFKFSNRVNSDLQVFRETLRTIFNALNCLFVVNVSKPQLQKHDEHQFFFDKFTVFRDYMEKRQNGSFIFMFSIQWKFIYLHVYEICGW